MGLEDFPLYFNILFFGMLALGMLFGFLRGLRKSLYHFLVKLLFYVIFFATLGIVVRFLWTLNIGYIGTLLGMLNIGGLGGVTSFSEAMPIILESMLGDTINADLSNPNFIAFAEGIGLFVLKILYAIVYFTVLQLLYRFLTWVVYMIFLKQSKEHVQEHGKKRLAGMGVGLASGLLAVFATLVILGGVMDVSTNMLALLAASETTEPTANRRFEDRYNSAMTLSTSPVPMEAVPMQTQEEQAIEALKNATEGYNNNIVVKNLTRIKLTDDETDRKTKLNLYFFDRIFSIDYETENTNTSVALRHELAVFTDVASIFMDSEFSESRDFTDITGDQVETLFNEIANSDLLVSLVPIALEMGQEHFEVDLDIERDALYDIDYRSELETMGSIASSAFSLLNTAGLLEDNPNYDTITLDGDKTKNIFDGLADSELATLAAYVAMEPMLEQALGASNTVVTVPEDIVWEDEFAAFGEVSKEILDTNITLGDIRSADPLVYIDRLSSMDMTVLLRSSIIEQAMVNVFTGEAGIEGMDMLVAHDDINWRDTYDGDVRTDGELRIMLEAFNTLADDAALDNLEDFDVNIILNISETTLDALFTSEVLGDTLGNFIVDMAEDPLIIPSTTLKTITVDGQDQEVVISDEIKNIFAAVQDLGIEDLTTLDIDPTLLKNLSLDSDDTVLDTTKTQNMFASEILHATLSDVLLDLTTGTDAVFIIPETDIDSNQIIEDHATDAIQFVSTDELNALLDAFLALDITDFNNIESIDLTRIKDDFDRLLNSAIIHATFSDQLLELTTDDTLNVPHKDETDTVEIRQTVSNTEFIIKTELEAVVDALDVLNLLDFQSFDGSVDLTVLETQANRDTVLASSILQATISKQLIDLDGDGTITLPYFDETGTTQIRTTTTSTTPTEYVIKDELDAVIRALDILDILDINNFTGDVDLSVLAQGTNAADVLESAVIQATISDQLIDLDTDGTLTVPYLASDDTTDIRLSVGDSGAGTDTEYVVKTEIESIIDSLDILGITDVTTFDGTVTLTDFYDEANRNILFASSVMHATLSDQLVGLDSDGTINLPYFDETGTTEIRTTTTSTTPTEYVIKDELHAMIEALEILGVTDINTFSGDVDLSVLAQGTNASDVLESTVIQATVSEQLIDLDTDGTLTVPYLASDDTTDIRLSVGDSLAGTDTDYVLKTEIESVIDALDILGITDVTTFTGTITLTDFYDETNRNTMLESSIMHATISKQALDLGTSILSVPQSDVSGTQVRVTTTGAPVNTEYITKDEIGALIESMQVMNITDINTFGGSFTLTDFTTETDQNTLLASASIHKTFSDELTNLGSTVLIVPDYEEDGSTPIRVTNTDSLEYVVKDEIKALIKAFDTMGYTDLDSFGASIDSTKFFNSRETLLLSSSIQATVSDKLLNDTGNVLLVPDQDINTNPVRLLSDTYIESSELSALLDGLDLLGLQSFGTMSFTPTNVFNADFNTILQSVSLQLTISDTILDTAKEDQASATVGDLIVPTALQESVNVDSVATDQIEKPELINLLEGLDALGVSDFDGQVDAATVTSMDQTTLSTMLDSGSIHVTVDHMVDSNTNIDVPDYDDANNYDYDAVNDTLHGINDITTKAEILDFVEAINTIASGDITSAGFDLTAIRNLNATQQGIIFDSMIARNTITPDMVSAYQGATLDPNIDFTATYYHDSKDQDAVDTTYLTRTGIENALADLEAAL